MHDWQPGVRVVVRRRLPDGSATDVVGTLLSAGPEVLVVRTRRGDVEVPVRDVVAGKAVPPAPVRRGPPHLALDVLGLEEVMAEGWRASDAEWLGGPGGWLLRAAAGFTGRANSALPLRVDDALRADDALAAVTSWYAARDLPATVVLPEPLDPDEEPAVPGLREALERAGWSPRNPTLVMVAASHAVAHATAHRVPVGLTDAPDQGWLSLYRYRGQAVPPVGRRLLVSAPRQRFAAIEDGGRTVAVGRLAVARGWGGITAMEVAGSHRRRGLGRAVLGALAGEAVRLHAPALYLQVAEDNEAGRSLYRSLGFTQHHRYSYWSPRAPNSLTHR